MAWATAARRVPALVLVAAAHALALAFLLELTRTHSFSGAAEESLTLIALLPAARPQSPELPLAISPGAARGGLTFARPGVTRPTETRLPEPRAAPATGPPGRPIRTTRFRDACGEPDVRSRATPQARPRVEPRAHSPGGGLTGRRDG